MNPLQALDAARSLHAPERAVVLPRALRHLQLLLVVAGFCWCGCATGGRSRAGSEAGYRPDNIYRVNGILPLDIRRVAVLPVSVERGDGQADSGRVELEKVLRAELNKTKAFEVVAVTREQLQDWTQRASWKADELLPADFLGQAQNALACDAILFVQLRPYHAYAPLVIGWNLKLVDARTGTILWAADEVFDAAAAPVARAALAYQRQQVGGGRDFSDVSMILSSPRQFGQYTLSALFDTLPGRK